MKKIVQSNMSNQMLKILQAHIYNNIFMDRKKPMWLKVVAEKNGKAKT